MIQKNSFKEFLNSFASTREVLLAWEIIYLAPGLK